MSADNADPKANGIYVALLTCGGVSPADRRTGVATYASGREAYGAMLQPWS
jgi:hypothetical protein